MNNLKAWQKAGLGAAGLFLLLSMVLRAVGGVWWYQETIWFRALLAVNYPAAELSRVLLNRVGIPRIYDAPTPWRETFLISLTPLILGMMWWFLLGTIGSIGWLRLAKGLRSGR